VDRDDALRVLRTMERIRRFEERVARLKLADEVYGLIHVSVGQEGVAAGTCLQLRDDDAVYSGHRAHGHALATGAPMERVMAELMGRDGGLCRGMGGSMHLVDVEHGLMGATGVVGGNVPMALGSALAARLRGSDAVAVVFFGDGAAQGGHVLETFNLASLWRLPLILVCENNGFAEFTPRSAHTVVERVSDAVAPYDFPRETVDGNDVRAVWASFGGFLERARAGEGPFLLECLTHRLSGHYVGDPAAYREALAAEEWQKLDPIVRLRDWMIDAGWLDADDAARVSDEAAETVEAAEAFARTSPYPSPQLTQELAGSSPTRLASRGANSPAPPSRAPGGTVRETYVKAVGRALTQAMRDDESVFVIGEDVAEGGPYTTTAGLAEEFGRERVRNTPISEAAITGAAIGAAQSGMRPVLEIMYIDFLTLALDQLVNAAAKAHAMSGGQLTVPLVLRTQGGAGHRGGAQHSQSLEAWLTHVPGLKVVMPSGAADAAGLMAAAIADPGPVVFVEHKALYFRREDVPDGPIEPIELGRARIARPGKDVTIVATSRMVGEALQAAEALSAEGIEAEVIDPRTLVPLDLETIVASVRRTNRLVVAHEAVVHGGFGAEVAAAVQEAAFDDLDAPIERVGAPFAPIPFSPPLEDAYVPGRQQVLDAVRKTSVHSGSIRLPNMMAGSTSA
jgi:pyruvate/2-oxoglutarate/acetoin dehydrogenase E1 component/TPP-dependent pyruvate/acetoin dehydrogenase alpha subunit